MPSSRAILADIRKYGLDSKVPHVLGKNGRLASPVETTKNVDVETTLNVEVPQALAVEPQEQTLTVDDVSNVEAQPSVEVTDVPQPEVQLVAALGKSGNKKRKKG